MAAAAFGGMVASGFIKVVIKEIGSAIKGEFKLHKNLRKDLEKMKMTLEAVGAVLSEADRRSITDEPTRLWLKRLQDALYEISDMLVDFEADSNLLEGVVKKFKMPNKMKEMQEKLQKISEDRMKYSVPAETRSDKQPVPDIRETPVNAEETDPIGRTDDKMKIMDRLSKGNTGKTTFVSIWGFGGIGKTTLARLVYKDPQFEEYSKAWVYVSEKFDLKKIGNSIISQLSEKEEQSKIDELKIIHDRLEKLLAGNKKILIILDDLWEKRPSELEKLKVMLKQAEGSKVMVVVTTREESTAKEIGSVDPYCLAPLTYKICWDIIKQKCNFEAIPYEEQERLEPIGEEIAKKCGGVPLAAQSLGHMLKSKPYDVWVSVRSNHIWNLPNARDTLSTHEVLASLLLSYNFIDNPSLKLCFAYCAIFPKGHNIIKGDLIHQWIALGFMEPYNNILSAWQLGESYVRHLLEMSFLQHSKTVAKRSYAREDATIFTMHDLVHDLARSVMADEFYLKGPNCRYAYLTNCTKPLKSSTTSPAKIKALHIVDHPDDDLKENQFRPDAYSQAKHLRVLVLDISPYFLRELPGSIAKLKQLRYLSIPNISGRIDPTSIAQLTKLNYLNLCGSTHLSGLPESISEIKGLMHLDLSYCRNLKELPLSFGTLRELVYLDLSHCGGILGIPEALGGLTKLQHLDLSECENLRGLPEVIGSLTELRYLNLTGCMHYIFDSSSVNQTESFIHCICTLPNMQQLDLSQNECHLSIPGSARRLRKLDLRGCSNVTGLPRYGPKLKGIISEQLDLLPFFSVYAYGTESRSNLYLLEPVNPEKLHIEMLENVQCTEEANSINISKKQNIGKLTLEWTRDANRCVEDMELLRELVPPTSLTEFIIDGYSSVVFPNWLMNITNYLPNLDTIVMWNLPNCSRLPPLAQLPNLRVLTLKGMESLEEWNTADSNFNGPMFPELREVNIHCCPKLRIKPQFPRAASWNISGGGNVLTSWGEIASHTGASSSSSPACTRLSVAYTNVPLLQWSLLHQLPALSNLKIEFCSDLTSSPEITRALHSLKSLTLSSQEGLMEWVGELTSLRHLRIECYRKLEELSDNMRQLTQLRSLTLESCDSLTSLPLWLGELASLKQLEITNCHAIMILPKSLTSLQELSIHHCNKIMTLPESLIGLQQLCIHHCDKIMTLPESLTSLQELTIHHCDEIMTLPESFTSLQKLIIQDCDKIITLPESLTSLQKFSIHGCDKIMKLPESLTSLQKLSIHGCDKIMKLPESLTSLQKLSIHGCDKIMKLPESLTSLQKLSIHGCDKIMKLPESLTSLQKLSIHGCDKIMKLPESITSLQKLSIHGCDKMMTLPESLTSLQKLIIHGCDKIMTLPESLTSLQKLSIHGCDKIMKLPESLASLQELSIHGCDKIMTLPESLTSLQELSIHGCEKIMTLPESLTSLQELSIHGCVKFMTLPESLTSLQELSIHGCDKIMTLPESLTSLQCLSIIACPKLKQWCEAKENKTKLAHIKTKEFE